MGTEGGFWVVVVAAAACLFGLTRLFRWFRAEPLPFYPPEHNGFIHFLMRRLFLPLNMRLWNKVVRVEFAGDARERLKALLGQRTVICPNHPSRVDSDLALHLATLLGQDWNYVAAWDVFQPRPQGWMLQQLGIYSVNRGTMDSASYRMTRQLLAAGARPLVLFPEGETCGQNDRVMPFQPGVVQMGFWALEDLMATSRTPPAPPPLLLVPVALKYLYLTDMRPQIDAALGRLERALGIATPASGRYARLRAIGSIVLERAERQYGVMPPAGATLDERIQTTREVIVARVARDLGVTENLDRPLLERVLALFAAVHRLEMEHSETPERARALYDDLWRALRFVATADGYVAETMTAERFLELIIRLEWEVYGRVRWRGPRKVVLQVGEPIDLAAQWVAYRSDKRGTVAAVTADLHDRVQAMVTALGVGAERLGDE